MDFSHYKFRASQVHLLMTGTIGLTDKEESRLNELLTRKKGHALGEKDDKDKPYKELTDNMKNELSDLIEKKKDQSLPKTMKNELRKIWRAETFGRNFLFTNKYVQKGILQEEEAITLYMNYRIKILKEKTFFTKNDQRLSNDWITGEWDLPTIEQIKESGHGFDIKNSWSLDTFPFVEDELDPRYLAQNRCYMDLTGGKKWTTVYCLVNGTEYLVFNEKQKHRYALNMPDEEDRLYPEWIKKCREVERMMIFDYDRFVEVNPHHIMEHSREEWHDLKLDIPLKDRVLEKTIEQDEQWLKERNDRIKLGREYLNSLNESQL